MKGYVIELLGRPRWGAECVAILIHHGIDAEIFPGVDGHACDPSELPVVHRWSKHRPTAGEIGCFASQVKFAKAILANTVEPVLEEYPDWFLLFEDDAIPRGGMCAFCISYAVAEADKAGFHHLLLHQGAYRRPPPGEMRVVPRPFVYRRGELHACLIRREAAAKIAAMEMRAAIDIAIGCSDIPVGVLKGGAGFSQRHPKCAPFSLYAERHWARRQR